MQNNTIPQALLDHLRRQAPGPRFIRLIGRTKKPMDKSWQLSPLPAGDPVIVEHVATGSNLGLICGSGLIVVDIDSDQGERAAATLPATFTVLTPSQHKHRYFTCRAARSKDLNGQPHVGEIRADGRFVVAPGSILNDAGERGDWRIIDERAFTTVTVEMLQDAFMQWWIRDKPRRAPHTIRKHVGTVVPLSQDEKRKLTEALVPVWTHGRRHMLSLYIVALLAKRGVPEEDTHALLDRVCDLAGDEERRLRLAMIPDQYCKAAADPTRLKGITGIREALSF